MKKSQDKMVKSGESMVEQKEDAARVEAPQEDGLVCVQECNVPNVGPFRFGEKIKDPAVIAKIQGSPCFKPIQEVE